MMSPSRFLCVGLLALVGMEARAADYVIDFWDASRGLPGNSATAIAQTPEGYLWVGGYDGLARFDGVRFVRFDSSNTKALGHTRVERLFTDNAGTLWINTYDGSLTSWRNGVFTAEWTARERVESGVWLASSTDREQVFLPTFDLLTKEGRVVKSDMETSAAVFNAIARREAKWPLKPALENAGPILVGEDQAKYGVAIWEEPSSEPGMFSVYVTGLSGETAPLTDSEGKPINDKDGQPILLRKTLQLDFNVRGDELYAGDPIDQTGKQWVMR